MKKINIEAASLIMLFGVMVICTLLIGVNTTHEIQEPQVIQVPEPEIIYERVEVPVEKVVTVEVEKVIKTDRLVEIQLTEDEKKEIAGTVYAEANNEDMIGKRLIVDVILNRVGKKGFAQDVHGVVNQDNQFCKSKYYTEDCMKAVEYEMYERLDYEIAWFRTGTYHTYGEHAYQHGRHYFSKFKKEGEE